MSIYKAKCGIRIQGIIAFQLREGFAYIEAAASIQGPKVTAKVKAKVRAIIKSMPVYRGSGDQQ